MIADAGHAVGVGVEAELGHVGLGSDYTVADAKSHFTQPDMVERFIHQTNIDYLAVAFGTAHGAYKQTPQLDLDLLAELNTVPVFPSSCTVVLGFQRSNSSIPSKLVSAKSMLPPPSSRTLKPALPNRLPNKKQTSLPYRAK